MSWCAGVDDDLQEGGLTDEAMGGVENHVRHIFEMDHPQLLPTYLYTFAEQVALQDRETQARHIAAVTKEGNIFTSGSVETEFDIFSSYQNFCNSIMTERELGHACPFSSNIL